MNLPKDIKINKRLLNELRREKVDIELHGNGFIKIPFGPNKRIHVFDPRLKKYAQEVSTYIHDHRFRFTSTVITGCLKQTIYKSKLCFYPSIESRPVFEEYNPDKNGKLKINPLTAYTLFPTLDGEFRKLSSYNLNQGIIHSVDSDEFTVTLMEKLFVFESLTPRVFCLRGLEPDNNFESPKDSSFLWEFVLDNFPNKV